MASKQFLEALGFTLKNELYVLKADVKNPTPDKRYRDTFDAAPVWKAGLLIVVRNIPGERELPLLYAFNGLRGRLVCSAENKPAWGPLLANMEVATNSLGHEFLRYTEVDQQTQWDARTVLAWLVEHKLIDMQIHIGDAVGSLNRMTEEEYEAFCKRHDL